MIRDGAKTAVRRLGNAAPPVIALPATLTVRFRNADLAEMATWVTGVTRADDLTVHITEDDPIRLYRAFVTVVFLTRGIAE